MAAKRPQRRRMRRLTLRDILELQLEAGLRRLDWAGGALAIVDLALGHLQNTVQLLLIWHQRFPTQRVAAVS